VDPIETHAIRKISGSTCSAFYGDICGMFIAMISVETAVTAVVFGYFKLDKKNNIIDAVDVDNPPVIMNTRGMWLDVPFKALEILSEKNYNIAGSIHAAEHAILSLLPNVVVTSPGDVRTECKAPQKEYAKVILLIIR
jgi:DEAD/DEAH box helicase domain-containing protein